MRFLILGSNAFSGASFIDWLTRQGFDVWAASRSPEAHPALLPYLWETDDKEKRSGRVFFHQIDFNHDLETLSALLRTAKPTHIVNFAAQSMVAESWLHPDHWMMTNGVGLARLLELLRRYETLTRYIHVTTPEVYGTTNGWITEGAAFNPSTPYASSRAGGDFLLRNMIARYDFPAIMTRAANIYGPGQPLYRIIPKTILAGLGGEKLQLDGGGTSHRVFIHASDVAEANFALATKGSLGEDYHISAERVVTIKDLVALILESLGKHFEDCVVLGPERAGKDTAYLLASTKLRSETGWRDKINLEEGVETVIGWSKRFASQIRELPSRYQHKP